MHGAPAPTDRRVSRGRGAKKKTKQSNVQLPLNPNSEASSQLGGIIWPRATAVIRKKHTKHTEMIASRRAAAGVVSLHFSTSAVFERNTNTRQAYNNNAEIPICLASLHALLPNQAPPPLSRHFCFPAKAT